MKVGDKVYLDGQNEVIIGILTDKIALVKNKDLSAWPVAVSRLRIKRDVCDGIQEGNERSEV